MRRRIEGNHARVIANFAYFNLVQGSGSMSWKQRLAVADGRPMLADRVDCGLDLRIRVLRSEKEAQARALLGNGGMDDRLNVDTTFKQVLAERRCDQ
jgi:hypothetical protein